ncbi:hypothetical protein TNIN_298361 [Trichonephila inaurata madagascariensis]|uniref:Uncharacterized protein n=1 Tax=Trichonephila inaurata madagascariensis TaxID=2747483 RepID=A0A8X6IIZ9_9ARAC|nr:hypothetical protein TNIN_298361 [Trichonephila inaurata madagascariensis]
MSPGGGISTEELKARCEAATEAKARCESEAQRLPSVSTWLIDCWEGWPLSASDGPNWPPISRPWSRPYLVTCCCLRPPSPIWGPSPRPTDCSC